MKRVAHGEPQKSKPVCTKRAFLFMVVMQYWVYIIQSETSGRFYCGQSSNVEQRLRQHNDPEYRLSKTTKRFPGPWKLIWTQSCLNRSEATRLERDIKKRGISRFLNSVQSRHWSRRSRDPAKRDSSPSRGASNECNLLQTGCLTNKALHP